MMHHKTSVESHMIKDIQKHHSILYALDILALIGLAAIATLLWKILKEHRRR